MAHLSENCKTIGEFFFCNGRLRLTVTRSGFTLWDMEERRWLIDSGATYPSDPFEIALTREMKKQRTSKFDPHLRFIGERKKQHKRVRK
jgi:hypothetical protein